MQFIVFLAFIIAAAQAFQRPSLHRGFVTGSRLHESDPTKDFFKKISTAIDNAGGVDGILTKTGDAAKKAAEAATKAAEAAKAFNAEHKLTDKALDAAKAGIEGAKKINEEYHLTDQAAAAAKQAAETAAKKIKEASQ